MLVELPTTNDQPLIAVAALVGLLFGSFLNVCIARLPKGQSVVRPRSRCPKCQAPIAARDNVPVLSWLLLRGRCRHCGNPISPIYPLVELGTAVIWGWCASRFGFDLEGLRYAVFGTLLLGIALTDAREFIIPHEFSFGGLGLSLLMAIGGGIGAVIGALDGAIFGAGLVYLIGAGGEFLFKREAMGGGDVAMMAMVGSFLGWQSVVATIFGGAVIGIVLHVAALPFRRKLPEPARTVSPSSEDATPDELRAAGYLPFGVSLAIAAGLIGLALGVERINAGFAWYAGLIGL